jgi:hypothetical protein
MEEWKTIQEFPNYEISSHGRVRKGEFILSQSKQTSGYFRVAFYKDSKHHYRLVHRLVGQAFLEPCPDKFEIDHINNLEKENNHISNLRWANRSEQNLNRSYSGQYRNIQKHGKRWVVSLWRNSINVYRKSFLTLEEAIKVRDEKIISLNQSYTVE